MLRIKPWSIPLGAIEDAGVESPDPVQLVAGGTRSRLELTLRGGEKQLFVFSDPKG